MLYSVALALDIMAFVYRSMEVFVSEGKQHAREAFWVSGPRPANVSSSEGQMDAQEVSFCDLNELRQVRLLTVSCYQ